MLIIRACGFSTGGGDVLSFLLYVFAFSSFSTIYASVYLCQDNTFLRTHNCPPLLTLLIDPLASDCSGDFSARRMAFLLLSPLLRTLGLSNFQDSPTRNHNYPYFANKNIKTK